MNNTKLFDAQTRLQRRRSRRIFLQSLTSAFGINAVLGQVAKLESIRTSENGTNIMRIIITHSPDTTWRVEISSNMKNWTALGDTNSLRRLHAGPGRTLWDVPEGKGPIFARARSNTGANLEIMPGGISYSALLNQPASLHEIMSRLAESCSFDFRSKTFSALGEFIEGIGGVPNAGGFFWTIHANGELSKLGASDLILRRGDEIMWKYEKRQQTP